MKAIKFILTAIFFIQLSCSADRNEVVITGQFVGEHPKEFIYTYPVNGTSYEGFSNTVRPDTSGQFRIRLNIDRPVLINFTYYDSPSLIIEPGNSYEIVLSSNKDNILEIGGPVSETQKVYSSFPYQNPRSCMYSYGEDFTNYQAIKQKLNNDLNNEISILDKLYDQNKVSKDVLNLLVTDRKIYYYTAQAVLASLNHLNKKNNNEEVSDEIFSIWSEAVNGIPLNSELFLSSHYSYDLLYFHLLYKIYTTYSYDEFVELLTESRVNKTHHALFINLGKEFLSDSNLEFYIAGSFHHQYMWRKIDNNLNALFEQFRIDYPESGYIPFVQKTVEKMNEKQP